MQITQRRRGYQFGVALLFVGVPVFIVGFSVPNWSEMRHDSYHGTFNITLGLWKVCDHSKFGSRCANYEPSKKGVWLTATQFFQGWALIMFLLAAGLTFVYNFVEDRCHSKGPEITAGCGSALGIIGAAIYAGETHKYASEMATWYGIKGPQDIDIVSWAFFVDFFGCIMILIAAVFLGAFNKSLRIVDDTLPKDLSQNPDAPEAVELVVIHQ